MIITVLSTEKIADGKYKVKAKEGEFFVRENGIAAGEYDVDTKPVMFNGQQVTMITSITPVEAKTESTPAVASAASERKAAAPRNEDDKWAKKDREIAKQTALKAVWGSPGLSMLAATKSGDEVGKFYSDQFKIAMKAFDEVR